jgi:hypothetical protein
MELRVYSKWLLSKMARFRDYLKDHYHFYCGYCIAFSFSSLSLFTRQCFFKAGKDLEEGDDEDDESAEEDSSKGNASSSRKQQGAATNDAIRALEASDDVSDGARDDVRGASGKAGNSGVGGVNSGSGDGGGGSNSSSSYPLRKDNSHDSLDSNGSAPQPVRRLTSEQEQVRAQKFQRKRPSKAANVDDQGNNSTNGDGSSSSRKHGGHGALSGGGAAAEEDESGSDDDGGSVVGVAMGSPGAGARGGSGSSKFKGPNGQFVQKLDSVEFGSIMDTLASQPVRDQDDDGDDGGDDYYDVCCRVLTLHISVEI